MIDVEQLSLSFGQGPGAARVLHDVSFSVAQGESFGLVGESGSGKTTLLRCLAGQFMHWSGALRLGDQPLGRTFDRARARMVQMVFQDPYGSLHPRHTVQTTLAEPLQIHQMDAQDERIGAMLRKVGLDDSFRHRYPHQLSGGNGSAWRLRGRSSWSLGCCCWTSRPRHWMSRCKLKSSTCSYRCASRRA